MCGGYGDTDGDGKSDGIGAFLTDIQDGGGPGRSGARFSSGDTSVLDSNNDNYVSEAEYMRGQLASEANEDRGRGGTFGDAYNNSRGVISNFSNSFGALPRGSIRQEAALGPQYGTPIETKNMARYLQMGGMPGATIRGVSGFLGGAADAAGDMGRALTFQEQREREEQTPEQQARSFDSIFNTGSSQFDKLPEDRRDAIIRGTRSLNPRAISVPVPVPAPVPETLYYDDDPYSDQKTNANLKDKVVFKDGMYNFYENGQLIRQITEQEYNQMLMNPYRTA